jgi:hypothetical protein
LGTTPLESWRKAGLLAAAEPTGSAGGLELAHETSRPAQINNMSVLSARRTNKRFMVRHKVDLMGPIIEAHKLFMI